VTSRVTCTRSPQRRVRHSHRETADVLGNYRTAGRWGALQSLCEPYPAVRVTQPTPPPIENQRPIAAGLEACRSATRADELHSAAQRREKPRGIKADVQRRVVGNRSPEHEKS
jgi:hypothetical protein